MAEACRAVHLDRIFEACYEKGSELPESDPRRKFKGRLVFQGNNVQDENSDHALFNELGSSPASMEASKLLRYPSLLTSPLNRGPYMVVVAPQ